MKSSASDKLSKTKMHVNNFTNKHFNMDLSERMDTLLRYRIRILTFIVGLIAFITVFFMAHNTIYLIIAVITGLTAFVIDFFVEYNGISKRDWDYPTTHLSFKKVPIEIPLLFFYCGILATFTIYCVSTQQMIILISSPILMGFSYVQIFLFLVGLFFMIQYFRGIIKSLVFWALPISIALYLSYSEPWVLVLSIFPMYIDYYLEKRLVKSAHIKYDRYGEKVATNVAISYFPATLFILGVVAILLNIFN